MQIKRVLRTFILNTLSIFALAAVIGGEDTAESLYQS